MSNEAERPKAASLQESKATFPSQKPPKAKVPFAMKVFKSPKKMVEGFKLMMWGSSAGQRPNCCAGSTAWV